MNEIPTTVSEYYGLQSCPKMYFVNPLRTRELSAECKRLIALTGLSREPRIGERLWKHSLTRQELASASEVVAKLEAEFAGFEAFCYEDISERNDLSRSATDTSSTDWINSYLPCMADLIYLAGRVALRHDLYTQVQSIFSTLLTCGDRVCRMCRSDLNHQVGLRVKRLAHELLWECVGIGDLRQTAIGMLTVLVSTPPNRTCFALSVTESVLLEVGGMLTKLATANTTDECIDIYLRDRVTNLVLPSYAPSSSQDGELALAAMELLGNANSQETTRVLEEQRARHELFRTILRGSKQVIDVDQTNRMLMDDARAFLRSVERSWDALLLPYPNGQIRSYNEWPLFLRLDRYSRQEESALTPHIDVNALSEHISALKNPLGVLLAGDTAHAINCCLDQWVDRNWKEYCIDYDMLRTIGGGTLAVSIDTHSEGVIIDQRRSQGVMIAVADKRLEGGKIRVNSVIPPSWQ